MVLAGRGYIPQGITFTCWHVKLVPWCIGRCFLMVPEWPTYTLYPRRSKITWRCQQKWAIIHKEAAFIDLCLRIRILIKLSSNCLPSHGKSFILEIRFCTIGLLLISNFSCLKFKIWKLLQNFDFYNLPPSPEGKCRLRIFSQGNYSYVKNQSNLSDEMSQF